MKHKILIVEDEPAILLALKDELSQEYQVFIASKAKVAMELSLQEHPDLVLLDLVLPDMDGFDLCAQFKAKGIDSGVIMLTARDQLVDKIKGLELGADDYITKPFSLEELKARIRAILRRRALAPAEEFNDGTLNIDFKKYRVSKQKKALKLSSLEFKLLRFLVSQKGKSVSRKELLEQVWGYDIAPSTRTVDVHILTLRKKLGNKYISTVHGEGYRFEA